MTFKKKLVAAAIVLAVVRVLAFPLSQYAAKKLYPVQFSESVEYWSVQYSLDPLLVYSIIRTESGFDASARSNQGAIGLMQITEETFSWIQSKIAADEPLSFENLYDEDTAVRFGCYYFSRCLERYNGDISTAAAAYHSGWGTVDALLEDAQYSEDGLTLSVFPYTEMQHYVDKINKTYQIYQKLYS